MIYVVVTAERVYYSASWDVLEKYRHRLTLESEVYRYPDVASVLQDYPHAQVYES